MVPAVLTFGGVVVAALGVLLGHLYKRVSDLENRVVAAEHRANALWSWGRKLLDLYYRHRLPDAPDPPEMPDYKD